MARAGLAPVPAQCAKREKGDAKRERGNGGDGCRFLSVWSDVDAQRHGCKLRADLR